MDVRALCEARCREARLCCAPATAFYFYATGEAQERLTKPLLWLTIPLLRLMKPLLQVTKLNRWPRLTTL